MAWLITWALLACLWICWQSRWSAHVWRAQQTPAAWHQEDHRCWNYWVEEPDQTPSSSHPPPEMLRRTSEPQQQRMLKTWCRRWETHTSACNTHRWHEGKHDRRAISVWTFPYCPWRHFNGSRAMIKASGVFLRCSAVTLNSVCDVLWKERDSFVLLMA